MAPATAPPASARLTLTRAVRLLATRRVTSVQLCSYCHELAELGDRPFVGQCDDDAGGLPAGGPDAAVPGGLGLNAFAQLASRDELLGRAAESDRRREAGLSLGPLDGIPVSVKANVAVRGWGLTAASRILNGWDYDDGGGGDDDAGSSSSSSSSAVGTGVSSGGGAASAGCGFDADVVHRLLRTGGAVLVGTTNLDEFGMGSLGTRALPPRHVRRDHWRRRRGGTGPQPAPLGPGLVRNPLPYLHYLVPPFVHHAERDGHGGEHDEDELDDLWAHHVTTPVLWRHPDLLHSISDRPAGSHNQRPTLSAGGSSSGSAASVSLGSSLLSVGTDTGGSVRLPAAWTGVVGFKPTYGLISRYGLVSYASSLDTVGLLAPTARCAALAMDAVANRDGDSDERCSGERDSTSVSVGVEVSVSDLVHGGGASEASSSGGDGPASGAAEVRDRPLRGLTVGIPSAFSVAECPPTIRRSWQVGARRLQSAGATVRTVLPEVVRPETVKTALAAYYVLACGEASSNLARYDGVEFGWDGPDEAGDPTEDADGSNGSNGMDGDSEEMMALPVLTPLESQFSKLRAQGFGPEVIRRILCGTSVLSSDRFHTHFEAAAKVRATMAREFNDAFYGAADGGGVDLMLVPTSLSLPPDLGEDGSMTPDSTEMFANDVMTVPISLAGLPSVSVPIRLEAEVEEEGKVEVEAEGGATIVGLQVFGPRLSEGRVLQAAHAIEDEASF